MALVPKGYVMSGDRVVASIENDIVTVLDKQRCPYFLMNISNIEMWLEDRAFDTTRGHSRSLRRVSNLTAKTDAEIALRFYGATITDNYWIKTEENGDFTYEDVRFETDQLFLLALSGAASDLNHKPEDIKSPQFTVSGCLEKGWKLEGDEWFLYKRANAFEQFNELFTSNVSKALGIETVKYIATSTGVKSANFAYGFNFEDMMGIVQKNSADYDFVYHKILDVFGPKAALDYIKLLYADAICCNQDRHSKNFGILRDIETGAFVSLAPNYDFNQSLFGDNVDVNTKIHAHEDYLISDLCNLMRSEKIECPLPQLTETELRKATQGLEFYPFYEDAIRFVLERQQLIFDLLPKNVPVIGGKGSCKYADYVTEPSAIGKIATDFNSPDLPKDKE